MADPVFRGFAFPFQRDGVNFPKQADDDDLIRDSLVQLILTARFERLMRPDFGTNALSFVFENNDGLLAENLRTEVMNVVGRFEPRVIIRQIQTSRQDTKILLTISYIVRATRQSREVQVTLPAP